MARRDEPFAIFLFGMRLNRLRGVVTWCRRFTVGFGWPP
jgi:hypothetical protein